MISTKQPVPDSLLGKKTNNQDNYKPLFANLDQLEDNIIPERDEYSVPTEDRADIDNRKAIHTDQDRYELFVKVKNDKKFALKGESSKLNSCARSRSMTNIQFNKTRISGQYPSINVMSDINNNESVDGDYVRNKKQNFSTDKSEDVKEIKESKTSKVIKSQNQIYSKLGVHSPQKFPDAIKNFYENVVTQNDNENALKLRQSNSQKVTQNASKYITTDTFYKNN